MAAADSDDDLTADDDAAEDDDVGDDDGDADDSQDPGAPDCDCWHDRCRGVEDHCPCSHF